MMYSTDDRTHFCFSLLVANMKTFKLALLLLGVASGQGLPGRAMVPDRAPPTTCHTIMCSVNAKKDECFKNIAQKMEEDLKATAIFQPGNRVSYVTRLGVRKSVTWFCKTESEVQVTCDQVGGEVSCPTNAGLPTPNN